MESQKKRKETLLLKYGVPAFLVIVVVTVVFIFCTSHLTKKPVESIYTEAIDNILVQSIDNAETWFQNQVEILNVFQRAVVNSTDNRDAIKERIKSKTKPNGFEYVMVFWDDATGAKDGGPETYNTKGGISTVGILSKEYWQMHTSKDVDVWLESPRKANVGGVTMPLFVKSNFIDDVTGETVRGGMVGFLELNPITDLGRTFYKTGNVSIYDDTNELRAGIDVLSEEMDTSNLVFFEKTFTLANKEWKAVATLNKSELGEITGDLRRNSVMGGFIVAIVLIICVLAIIRMIIGKFDSIKKNIDNLNTGDKDLTKRIKVNHNNEISEVKNSINFFVNTIHETVKQIGNANVDLKSTFENVREQLENALVKIDNISEEITKANYTLKEEDNCVLDTSSSVTQISENIKQLNEMISSQVQAITEASSRIEEMNGSIQSVSSSVSVMSKEFEELKLATDEGIEKNRIVNELLDRVLAQSASLQDTNRIISDISSQTNLLSMNAMIESAHAGESGKGFAVVAEEIRKLADTSAKQSKSISENLKLISENISKVVESSNSSKLSFELVSQKTNITSDLVDKIKYAMDKQAIGSNQLLDVISSMTNISHSVQDSSKEIDQRANDILSSISSLKKSSENMSENFVQIVETTKSTKNTTEELQDLAKEMTSAVNNISEKINEFKV